MALDSGSLKPKGHVYFMGIAGTGMASVAGLCREAGYKVTGSENDQIYPPMSTMLEELKIPVAAPYATANIDREIPDLVVVANALSRGNPEIETVLTRDLPYTSFPKLLGDYFLKDRASIVVAGTHGKTTTTSLMAHVLHELGEDPSFMIGGIPRNFPRSFRLASGATFVIEGDEYDTAFFDKGPKFLHYRPKHLIANNIEFDHADIYKDVDAIEEQFEKLMALVPTPDRIIANVDDPGIARVIKRLGLTEEVLRVGTLRKSPGTEVWVDHITPSDKPDGRTTTVFGTKRWGALTIDTVLNGTHNMANIAQVLGCLISLERQGDLRSTLSPERIVKALGTFAGVKRRLELLASSQGIDIYEDFAHHPTAVSLVIEGFRKAHPKKRLIVAFEPKNATSRRNIFQNDYVQMLGKADRVLIGACPQDKRVADAERMSTSAIVQGIGAKASAFDSNESLLETLRKEIKTGDAVIFMSSGSFSGIQYKIAKDLSSKNQ